MKEPTGSKSYILNTSRVGETELDLVGERALNISSLAKIGAPTPNGFVITSKVFDDFLFANNLIAEISNINSHLVRGLISSKKSQLLIKNLIAQANYPNLIMEMLYRAYGLLVTDKTIPLQLFPSALNPQLKESLFKAEKKFFVVEDFEGFLNGVKRIWLQLFTAEVLDYRVQTKYKGIISTAVVVNRFVQPEIAGTAYTMSVDNANPDLVELRATYGIAHDTVYTENFPDRYLYQRSTERLVAKTVNKQKWMLVLKNSKPQKLSMAGSRQKEQKLSDLQIINLAQIASRLKSHYKNELKIDWQFQSGKFIFTNLSRLREQEILDARKSLIPQIDSKQGKSTPSLAANPITENFQLQPIDRLTKVLHGAGNRKGVVYGRVKHIRNAADFDSVQGVNILVLKKPTRNMSLKQIHFRGIIVENNLDEAAVETPMISGVANASSLLLENEIVTLNTDTGDIYLGAGRLPVVPPIVEKVVDTLRPETVNTKEITVTMQRPVSTGIFKPVAQNDSGETVWLPEQQPYPFDAVEDQTQEIFPEHKEDPIAPVSTSRQIDEEWYLKSPEYKDLLKFSEGGCEYWQTVNLENPLLLDRTKGVFLYLSQIVKALDVDAYELTRNKPLQKKFIEFCARYLEQYSPSQQLLVVCDVVPDSRKTLEHEGLFELQLDIVKHLRNKLNMRNVSVVLPDIRSEKELVSMKKLVTANGLRRSATFSVLCEVVSPLAVISVQKIIDEGVDGLVINLDKLLQNLTSEENYKLTSEVTEFVVDVIKKINTTTVPVYLGAKDIALTDDHLEKFLESGAFRFVFPEGKIRELGPMMSNMEVKMLSKKSAKKGRRKKEINFG